MNKNNSHIPNSSLKDVSLVKSNVSESYNIEDEFKSLKDEIKDQRQTEIELQEMSLASLLESIPNVDFLYEKQPKIRDWQKEVDKLSDLLFDLDGNLINEKGDDYIKFTELNKKIKTTILKRQELSVLVVKVFKRVVLDKDLDLMVFNEEIYFYNGKYWQNITKERFASFLGDVANKMGLNQLAYEHHSFGNDLIKQFLHKNFKQPIANSRYTFINLQNGTYKFFKGKGRLFPHDKNDNLYYVLPFSYEPNATCYKFQEYIEYCLPDKDKQKVIQEFLGYIFTPNSLCNLEKCLLLYGEGSNGKSVLYNVINALLGKDNISSYSIPQLTDRQKGEYYVVNIQTKLLNYCSDTKGAFDDTGVFKQLVSGEKVTGRHPAGRPVDFVNNTKFIFNVNVLPPTPENVFGFFRRFEIIDFSVTVDEEKKDRQLATKIIDTELSGVFNWILVGLERLLKNKKLTHCKANEDALERFKIKSNNVLEFLIDEGFEVAVNIEHGEIFSELFQKYQTWIAINGGQALKKSNFKDRIDGLKLHGKQLFRDEKCNGNRHRVNVIKG
jgi:putative DNA primase/helicase